MTALVPELDFTLPPHLEAHEPPEARGLDRDGVRLLVGRTRSVAHHTFTELPGLLRPGDVLVVNTSATVPAALDAGELVVHVSTPLPDGSWLVELRRPSGRTTAPYAAGDPGDQLALTCGGTLTLLTRYSTGRLWRACLDLPDDVVTFLHRHGRPIRYGYVDRDWPLAAYQTVFARQPGSAEMPSAGRPFTDRLVTRLVSAGVQIAPIVLHTGVASPEAHERPYPERYTVPAATARVVNAARAGGGRVVAVGTTVVRALEAAAGPDGLLRPRAGWTDLVVTPERGVRAVDGLLTGFHEPRASHLLMLAAVAGDALLQACYREALDAGYLWHEFGDVNLLLP